MSQLATIFASLVDFNLRSTLVEVDEDPDHIFEFLDTEYDLFHELTIHLFNDYFHSLSDKTNPEYLASLADVYLLTQDGQRIFLTALVPLIGEGDGEWTIEGEEDYLDY